MDMQFFVIVFVMDMVQLFGMFYLGDFELVLLIGVLQEVVLFFLVIIQVLLVFFYLLGLFNLCGMLIFIVYLGCFFGLVDDGDCGEVCIVIVVVGDVYLGVLFDCIGEMLCLLGYWVVLFCYGSELLGLIESVFYLDQGGCIVQVLLVLVLMCLLGLLQVLNLDFVVQVCV